MCVQIKLNFKCVSLGPGRRPQFLYRILYMRHFEIRTADSIVVQVDALYTDYPNPVTSVRP
jgi:hypothetical protein